MIPKYLASLAVAVLLASIACATMRFATRSQVLSGTGAEDTWSFSFTLDADSTHTIRITPPIQAAAQRAIAFVAQGPVQIDSVTLDIKPQDVTWVDDTKNVTSAGAGVDAHVKWETSADSANDAHGDIRMLVSEIPGLGTPHIRSSTFPSQDVRDDQGPWILREVNTYRSASSMFFARLGWAFVCGLPLGILLQSLGWAFVLRKEKRKRIAALPPQGSQPGRIFYPNPVREWTRWTYVLGFSTVMPAFFAFATAADGSINSHDYRVILSFQLAGVLAALVVVYLTRRSVVTLRVDADGVSYTHGRGALPWVTERWADVLKAGRRSWSYAGRRYWERLEIEFTDLNKKKLKVPKDTLDYADLRDLLLSSSAPQKAPDPLEDAPSAANPS